MIKDYCTYCHRYQRKRVRVVRDAQQYYGNFLNQKVCEVFYPNT